MVPTSKIDDDGVGQDEREIDEGRASDATIYDSLHQLIENVQIIVLTAELLKEELAQDSDPAVSDMIDQIISRASDNSQIVSEIRESLRQIAASKSEDQVKRK